MKSAISILQVLLLSNLSIFDKNTDSDTVTRHTQIFQVSAVKVQLQLQHKAQLNWLRESKVNPRAAALAAEKEKCGSQPTLNTVDPIRTDELAVPHSDRSGSRTSTLKTQSDLNFRPSNFTVTKSLSNEALPLAVSNVPRLSLGQTQHSIAEHCSHNADSLPGAVSTWSQPAVDVAASNLERNTKPEVSSKSLSKSVQVESTPPLKPVSVTEADAPFLQNQIFQVLLNHGKGESGYGLSESLDKLDSILQSYEHDQDEEDEKLLQQLEVDAETELELEVAEEHEGTVTSDPKLLQSSRRSLESLESEGGKSSGKSDDQGVSRSRSDIASHGLASSDRSLDRLIPQPVADADAASGSSPTPSFQVTQNASNTRTAITKLNLSSVGQLSSGPQSSMGQGLSVSARNPSLSARQLSARSGASANSVASAGVYRHPILPKFYFRRNDSDICSEPGSARRHYGPGSGLVGTPRTPRVPAVSLGQQQGLQTVAESQTNAESPTNGDAVAASKVDHSKQLKFLGPGDSAGASTNLVSSTQTLSDGIRSQLELTKSGETNASAESETTPHGNESNDACEPRPTVTFDFMGTISASAYDDTVNSMFSVQDLQNSCLPDQYVELARARLGADTAVLHLAKERVPSADESTFAAYTKFNRLPFDGDTDYDTLSRGDALFLKGLFSFSFCRSGEGGSLDCSREQSSGTGSKGLSARSLTLSHSTQQTVTHSFQPAQVTVQPQPPPIMSIFDMSVLAIREKHREKGLIPVLRRFEPDQVALYLKIEKTVNGTEEKHTMMRLTAFETGQPQLNLDEIYKTDAVDAEGRPLTTDYDIEKEYEAINKLDDTPELGAESEINTKLLAWSIGHRQSEVDPLLSSVYVAERKRDLKHLNYLESVKSIHSQAQGQSVVSQSVVQDHNSSVVHSASATASQRPSLSGHGPLSPAEVMSVLSGDAGVLQSMVGASTISEHGDPKDLHDRGNETGSLGNGSRKLTAPTPHFGHGGSPPSGLFLDVGGESKCATRSADSDKTKVSGTGSEKTLEALAKTDAKHDGEIDVTEPKPTKTSDSKPSEKIDMKSKVWRKMINFHWASGVLSSPVELLYPLVFGTKGKVGRKTESVPDAVTGPSGGAATSDSDDDSTSDSDSDATTLSTIETSPAQSSMIFPLQGIPRSSDPDADLSVTDNESDALNSSPLKIVDLASELFKQHKKLLSSLDLTNVSELASVMSQISSEANGHGVVGVTPSLTRLSHISSSSGNTVDGYGNADGFRPSDANGFRNGLTSLKSLSERQSIQSLASWLTLSDGDSINATGTLFRSDPRLSTVVSAPLHWEFGSLSPSRGRNTAASQNITRDSQGSHLSETRESAMSHDNRGGGNTGNSYQDGPSPGFNYAGGARRAFSDYVGSDRESHPRAHGTDSVLDTESGYVTESYCQAGVSIQSNCRTERTYSGGLSSSGQDSGVPDLAGTAAVVGTAVAAHMTTIDSVSSEMGPSVTHTSSEVTNRDHLKGSHIEGEADAPVNSTPVSGLTASQLHTHEVLQVSAEVLAAEQHSPKAAPIQRFDLSANDAKEPTFPPDVLQVALTGTIKSKSKFNHLLSELRDPKSAKILHRAREILIAPIEAYDSESEQTHTETGDGHGGDAIGPVPGSSGTSGQDAFGLALEKLNHISAAKETLRQLEKWQRDSKEQLNLQRDSIGSSCQSQQHFHENLCSRLSHVSGEELQNSLRLREGEKDTPKSTVTGVGGVHVGAVASQSQISPTGCQHHQLDAFETPVTSPRPKAERRRKKKAENVEKGHRGGASGGPDSGAGGSAHNGPGNELGVANSMSFLTSSDIDTSSFIVDAADVEALELPHSPSLLRLLEQMQSQNSLVTQHGRGLSVSRSGTVHYADADEDGEAVRGNGACFRFGQGQTRWGNRRSERGGNGGRPPRFGQCASFSILDRMREAMSNHNWRWNRWNNRNNGNNEEGNNEEDNNDTGSVGNNRAEPTGSVHRAELTGTVVPELGDNLQTAFHDGCMSVEYPKDTPQKSTPLSKNTPTGPSQDRSPDRSD